MVLPESSKVGQDKIIFLSIMSLISQENEWKLANQKKTNDLLNFVYEDNLVVLVSVTNIFKLFQLVNSSFCNGEHEYIAADGSCKQCEMCPAGSEPTPVSGFISKYAFFAQQLFFLISYDLA